MSGKSNIGDFYVYRHIRLDSNTPFYVGKGKIRYESAVKETNRFKRAFNSYHRNDYWKRIASKHGYEVEIIMEDLTEDQAFEKEIEFITLYKNLGYCETNFTNGGEGTSGLLKSRETRLKIAKSHGAKPFEVFKTSGEFVGQWESMKQCSRDLEIGHEAIWQILKKKSNRKSTKGYTFRYLGDKTSVEELIKRVEPAIKSKNLSKALKGKFTGDKNPFYGKKHSPETRHKISEMSKKTTTGKKNPNFGGSCYTPFGTFESAKEASEKLNIPYSTIIARCRKTKERWKDWFLNKDSSNE